MTSRTDNQQEVLVDVGATKELAEYTATLRYEDIPSDVVGQVKLHLLDAVGAALYGHSMPWTTLMRDLATDIGARGESVVWNSSLRLPAAFAAFVNSAATHAFELDDRRVASYMHPASATLPAGLATADELGHTSGTDLLTAIVAGYEAGLRVGKCIGRGALLRGFYSPGMGGSFAAAMTAAKLHNLGTDEICHVMNLAATQASGLYSPTPIKRLNLGHGTFAGVLAVELARRGYRGVDDVLEREVGGFCAAVVDDPDLELLTAGLGEEYETRMVELKPYVSSRPNHTAIDATLQLHRDNPTVDPGEIKAVEIEVGKPNYDFGAGFDVNDVPSALMSVAYCAAVALLDGAAFLEQFTEERLRDAAVQDLLARTRVICNKDFDEMGLEARDHTVVRWHLTDGRTLEVAKTYATGHPSSPLGENEVRSKFHRLADPVIGDGRAGAIEEALGRLEQITAGDLSRVLVSGESQ